MSLARTGPAVVACALASLACSSDAGGDGLETAAGLCQAQEAALIDVAVRCLPVDPAGTL
jgi:hypothetical protein